MNDPQEHYPILLGAGGSAPGIRFFDSDAGKTTRIVDLPVGHSPYGFDIDLEQSLLAFGTRAGRIGIISYPPPTAPDGYLSFLQGAPVLAVCLLANGTLAASDTAGRCLLFRTGDPRGLRDTMDCGRHCICSLLRLPDGNLAGLATDGALLIWDPASRDLVHVADGPKPPRLHALVRMAYWARHGCIVYPVTGGHVAFYSPGQPDVSTMSAHQGEFYVMMPTPDGLYTVGSEDRLLRIWHQLDGAPAAQYSVPSGTIAGASVVTDHMRLVLIGSDGAAGIYQLTADRLEFLQRLEGNAYRTAAGPSYEAVDACNHRHRLANARQLALQIEQNMEQGQTQCLDSLHSQLVELGYSWTSLELRAQMAQRQKDPLAELRAWHQLAQTMPADVQKASPFLRQYARVLEATWQLQEAACVYRNASQAAALPDDLAWLTKTVGVLGGQDWIVNADVPISVVAEAATILNKSLVGRWKLTTKHPIVFPEGGLPATSVAAKYDQVRTERGRPSLPCATVRSLWWICRENTQQVDTILFGSDHIDTSHLELAVQVLPDRRQTVLAPSILLRILPPTPANDIPSHNTRAAAIADTDRYMPEGDSWMEDVAKMLVESVRRLHTLAVRSRQYARGT